MTIVAKKLLTALTNQHGKLYSCLGLVFFFFLSIVAHNLPISISNYTLNKVNQQQKSPKKSAQAEWSQYNWNILYKCTRLKFLMLEVFVVTLQDTPLLTSSVPNMSVKFQQHILETVVVDQWLRRPYIGPFIHTYREAKVLRPHTHYTGYNASSHPHTKRLKNRGLHCDAILCKCDARSPADATGSSDVV